MLRGWIHPELKLSVELVADVPMDGLPEPGRFRLVAPPGEKAHFRILSLEDLIADRAGQYSSGSAPEMREQARILLSLYPDADRAYLEARMRQETLGELGTEDFEG